MNCAMTILVIIIAAVGMAGALWLGNAIWYWSRVGWRWGRRNPPKGRFW